MDPAKTITYISKVGTYEIHYPEDYILEDDNESGIVTVTKPDGSSNLTLSSYVYDEIINEDILLDFFKDMVEDFQSISDLKQYKIKKYISFEQRFRKDGQYWIWWIYANKSKVVAASVNSNQELINDDYNLYKFILNSIEIFSD